MQRVSDDGLPKVIFRIGIQAYPGFGLVVCMFVTKHIWLIPLIGEASAMLLFMLGCLSEIVVTAKFFCATGPLDTVHRDSRLPEDARAGLQILLASDSRSPGNIADLFCFFLVHLSDVSGAWRWLQGCNGSFVLAILICTHRKSE